jgi:hypothetical protein|nr:hypothetical protein [Rhodospirillales bacterium]
MSIRESIASNLLTTLTNMTTPVTLIKVERDSFDFERLSNAQFPAAWIQSGEESKSTITVGSSSKIKGIISYTIIGFVKSSTIDSDRNELIESIEIALFNDVTRGGYAIETKVTSVSTDEGAIDPVGGIVMSVEIEYHYLRGNP